uniref:Uncharacterized protein n=1 Tax=Anabas testudineus TaxID=64144 RepID=A0A7N6ABU0_ANATE
MVWFSLVWFGLVGDLSLNGRRLIEQPSTYHWDVVVFFNYDAANPRRNMVTVIQQMLKANL